eukprot:gnl/TRDRNA2_/TRDRNA2_165362_c0_seq2.p2 gnl/TRDRNA2_/TRDRNA2_165362_c0~~gnl/TRDRNA2_/TRDRNA2_165362_c0_seq2.p2  ORF type:complete len:151 (+),score=10.35 gnl/TRDRNA2_/TRDRNA2_165362_c0_seq2:90-542(+)
MVTSGQLALRLRTNECSRSRWNASFGKEDARRSVAGISKYFLKSGRVYAIEEDWEMDTQAGKYLADSLRFHLTRRPMDESQYSKDGFVPAYKYAVWESVRTDENFPRDEILREDVDQYSPGVLYACLGIAAADVFLVVAKIFKTLFIESS